VEEEDEDVEMADAPAVDSFNSPSIDTDQDKSARRAAFVKK
jgi:hypothetical protein